MSSFEQTFSASGLDPDDLRAAWREACNDVRCAYDAWRTEGPAGSADRFAVYVAAADREAAAAEVLARYAPGRDTTDVIATFPTVRPPLAADVNALQADRRRCRRLS